jgi:hypothetical protein
MTNLDRPAIDILNQNLVEVEAITSATVAAIGVGYPVTLTTGVDGSPMVVKRHDPSADVRIDGIITAIAQGFPTDPSNNLRYIAANTARKVKIALTPKGTILSVSSNAAFDSSSHNNTYMDLVVNSPGTRLGEPDVELGISTTSGTSTNLSLFVLGRDTSKLDNTESTSQTHVRVLVAVVNGSDFGV